MSARTRPSLIGSVLAPVAVSLLVGLVVARFIGAPLLAVVAAAASAGLGMWLASRTIERSLMRLSAAEVVLTDIAAGRTPVPAVAGDSLEASAIVDASNAAAAYVERHVARTTQERREFRAALEAASTAIASVGEAKELFDLTVRETVRILHVTGASVLVPREAGGLAVVATAGSAASRAVGAVENAMPRSAVSDALAKGALAEAPSGAGRQEIAVPILVDQKIEAVLVIEGDGETMDIHEDEVPVLNMLARQVQIALGNIMSHEAARRDREKYRAVVEYAVDGILVRREAEIVFANRAMRGLIGDLELPMPVTEFFARYVAPDDRRLIEEHYRARTDGSSGRQKHEVHLLRPDGSSFPVQIDGNSITFEGSAGSLIFVRDLTDLKHAEHELRDRNTQLVQAEKLAAIGTLAAGVAHEVNNPLAFLRGNIEIMKMDLDVVRAKLGPGDAEGAKIMDEWATSLDVNLAGLDRIATIVRSLGQFSKPTNDRKEVDLAHVADTALLLASTRFKGRRVTVKKEIARDLPRVVASETQIGQILLNLIVNAADAMSETGGDIRLSSRADAECVTIEVTDTGPGIDPEKAARVFTAFFTTKTNGMGLGLSISRSIAEEHGGSLDFTTTVGEGTTFRLRLPRPGVTLPRAFAQSSRGPALPISEGAAPAPGAIAAISPLPREIPQDGGGAAASASGSKLG